MQYVKTLLYKTVYIFFKQDCIHYTKKFRQLKDKLLILWLNKLGTKIIKHIVHYGLILQFYGHKLIIFYVFQWKTKFL